MELSMSGYEALFKVVFVGDPGVEKRDVIFGCVPATQKELDCQPSMAKIGIDFIIRCLEIEGKTFKAQLWDAAGQERFQSITPAYYRGAAGVVIVYDTTQEQSFQSVERWLGEVREQVNPSTVFLLVGTQRHLKHLRMVTTGDAEALAERCGLMFVESDLDPSGLQAVFRDFVVRMYGKMSEFESNVESQLAESSTHSSGKVKIKKTRTEKKNRGQRQGCCRGCALL